MQVHAETTALANREPILKRAYTTYAHTVTVPQDLRSEPWVHAHVVWRMKVIMFKHVHTT